MKTSLWVAHEAQCWSNGRTHYHRSYPMCLTQVEDPGNVLVPKTRHLG